MPTFFWLLKLEPTLVFECYICLQNNSQRQLEHSKFNANLKIFLSKTTEQNSKIFYPNSNWVCSRKQMICG